MEWKAIISTYDKNLTHENEFAEGYYSSLFETNYFKTLLHDSIINLTIFQRFLI